MKTTGVLLVWLWWWIGFGALGAEPPRRFEILHQGEQRAYFVQLPAGYDASETYWILVSVHGGGGNGKSHFLANGYRAAVQESGVKAIVVSPSFSNEDFQASRFPALGEGDFLKAILAELRTRHRLRKKILLSGYSRGGQFAHRFALANPDLVQAVAPFSAGTWTTPSGELLIEGLAPVEHPQAYLTNADNARLAPERLNGLFTSRVAAVAGRLPHAEANQVPFLVMCGSLDSRFGIAQQFYQSMRDSGYTVEAVWPRTPHGSRNKPEFSEEFEKYVMTGMSFFERVTNGVTEGN